MSNLYEVRFETKDGSQYRTNIAAFSNGGAENRVFDVLCDTVVRCQAFDPDDLGIASELYPDTRLIDAVELYRLAEEPAHADETVSGFTADFDGDHLGDAYRYCLFLDCMNIEFTQETAKNDRREIVHRVRATVKDSQLDTILAMLNSLERAHYHDDN